MQSLRKKSLRILDEYLSACQLGITITALGIRMHWANQHLSIYSIQYSHFLIYQNSLTSILSIAFAFAIMTFLHVVVGELAPKTVAIQKAEKITLLTARPLILFIRSCIHLFGY